MRISMHDEKDAGQGRATVTTPSQVRALKHSIVMLLPGICACLVLTPPFPSTSLPVPSCIPLRSNEQSSMGERGRVEGRLLVGAKQQEVISPHNLR